MVTGLRNGRSGARIPAGGKRSISLLPKLPDRLWGAPSLPLNGYRFFFCFVSLEVERSGHEVAYFHLVPRIGLHRAIPLLLYTFVAFRVSDLLLVEVKGLTTSSD
jgi:hypothetical protein